MGIISMLAGCGNNPVNEPETRTASKAHRANSKQAITIDYSDYPDNFMIQLLPGQKYTLKQGDSTTEFCANTDAWLKGNQFNYSSVEEATHR